MHAGKHACACGGGIEIAKKSNPLRVLRLAESHPGCDACPTTVSEWVRNGLGAGPTVTATRRFRRV